jgi:hypothetical protein
MQKRARKQRRTFTIDHDLCSYLEAVRVERRKPSASSALEDILRESRERHQMRKIQHAMTGYYDSLSEAEREENRAWGGLGESQLGRE